MTENKPFWMVVREGEGGNAPTVQHPDEEAAYKEAARLLKKNPHRRFWVMQAIGGVYNTMQMTTVQFKAPITDRLNIHIQVEDCQDTDENIDLERACSAGEGGSYVAGKDYEYQYPKGSLGEAVENLDKSFAKMAEEIQNLVPNSIKKWLLGVSKELGSPLDGASFTAQEIYDACNRLANLPILEQPKVDLKYACSLREDVYLHPENKPELESGCIVGGVNHKAKKKADTETIRIRPEDYNDVGIFEKPTKACTTQTTAHLESIRDHYKGLGLNLQFSIRPTLKH